MTILRPSLTDLRGTQVTSSISYTLVTLPPPDRDHDGHHEHKAEKAGLIAEIQGLEARHTISGHRSTTSPSSTAGCARPDPSAPTPYSKTTGTQPQTDPADLILHSLAESLLCVCSKKKKTDQEPAAATCNTAWGAYNISVLEVRQILMQGDTQLHNWIVQCILVRVALVIYDVPAYLQRSLEQCEIIHGAMAPTLARC
jgi:hypothetical protein